MPISSKGKLLSTSHPIGLGYMTCGQPNTRSSSHGEGLRPSVRQEAASAWTTHESNRRIDPARLFDARRGFGGRRPAGLSRGVSRKRARLPLPGVKRDQNDVLTFNFDGNMERVLRYEHFSVVMSKGRRLCRFSAVNIDGRESKSFPRGAWRTDPRIPNIGFALHPRYGSKTPGFRSRRRSGRFWSNSVRSSNRRFERSC
jgi:hypothetical protein